MSDTYDADVLVVGSSIAGATYARKLVDHGLSVLMIEAAESAYWSIGPDFGDHTRNKRHHEPPYPSTEIDARYVGGKSIYWTGAAPEQSPIERSTISTDSEWQQLYQEARGLVGANPDLLKDSIQQRLILDTLKSHLGDRQPTSIPVAAKKHESGRTLVWSAASTVLGDTPTRQADGKPLFTLLLSHQVTSLQVDEATKEVKHAKVKDLSTGETKTLQAKKYVVCGGPLHTPQLLHASGFRPSESMNDQPAVFQLPALGHYLTQPIVSSCLVVLKQDLAEKVLADTTDVLDPFITMAIDASHKWYVQISRDGPSSAAPPNVDRRITLNIRFFSVGESQQANSVEFEDGIQDRYGMLQPKVNFALSSTEENASNEMINEMTKVAGVIGGYYPGYNPSFLPLTQGINRCGTTRAGDKKEDSCCNKFSQVWDVQNLYLGGCSVVPGGGASDLTLTEMCFAIKGADHIIQNWK